MTRHPPRRQRRALTPEATPPPRGGGARRPPARRRGGGGGGRGPPPPPSRRAVAGTGHVWRATGAECAGTLLLVLVAAGGPTIAATGNGSPGRAALALAPGLTVTALIYALGAISGAHFNPVATLVFAARRDFP